MIWTILYAVIHDKFNLFHQNDGIDAHIQRRKCFFIYLFHSQSPKFVPMVSIDYIVSKTHFVLLLKKVTTKAQTINHVAPCCVLSSDSSIIFLNRTIGFQDGKPTVRFQW